MIINNFDIKLNVENVLNTIHCYEENEIYNNIINIFYEIEEDFYKYIKPKAIYDFYNNKFKEFENAIFLLFTLGNTISDFSCELMENGEYIKGVIINSMADNYLMQMDKIICNKIYEISSEFKFGLSERFVPYMNIDKKWQKIICDTLKSDESEIICTSEYILKPLKTLSFIIAADKKIPINNINHNCNNCNISNCEWRKHK